MWETMVSDGGECQGARELDPCLAMHISSFH